MFNKLRCGLGCGLGLGRGRGRQTDGSGLGLGGECVCPECGEKISHERGASCYEEKCSKCGAKMTRKE